MNAITVISLGPGPREYLTLGAVETLKKAEKVILRTRISCDAADYLTEIGVTYETLDDLHETCEDFEELKARAAERLLRAAAEQPVCYAVFDASADETVAALRTKAEVTVVPGVKIGDGAVIGAGSVVTRDIPDHVIAAGVPARVIRAIHPGEKPRQRKDLARERLEELD